ncbi:MAG TPA: STT3 domain-containing protein [Anaerolineales bacterium]|nr:STT3 domain-containing protein [Anaerolineales bacterium]
MATATARPEAGPLRRRWRERATVALLLASGLAYGVLHASDYGQSWDDPGDAGYGQAALRAYFGSQGYLQSGDRMYYGPVYFMLAGGLSEAVHSIVPAWEPVDIRHALNFAAFQVALLAFYALARRLIRFGPALLATLLFALQPVFFGHAFVNQKDIPFLAAFILSVYLGVRVAERSEATLGASHPSTRRAFASGWSRSPRAERALLLFSVVLAAAVSADLYWGHTIKSWVQLLLASAYRGDAWPPFRSLFALVAKDAYKTSLSTYAAKLQEAFSWLRVVALYLIFLPAIGLGLAISSRGGALDSKPGQVIRSVVPAALALGVAMSIRVAGAFAGVLVSVILVWRRGRRSLSDLALYWLLGLSLCYLTWPYLWDAPIQRFIEAAGLTANFPGHFVLFRGLTMSSADLPWSYLPTLLSVQLTEPALILMVVGLVALRPLWREDRGRRPLLILLFIWFLVPLLVILFGRVPLYSNFRQVLFMLPPLFFLAGLGIGSAWMYLRSPAWRLGFGLLVLLPGLMGILQLHPYEYIYYNGFAGGVRGSEGRYPHDYWCTSYREAMAHINSEAPLGARVAIAEPFEVAASFARPDLDLVRSMSDPEARYRLRCNNEGDFTSRNLDEFPGAFAVTRLGVPLSVVLGPGTAAEATR